MPEPKKIGFVGLGAMGFGMASQLLKNGFQVAAVDTRSEVKPRSELNVPGTRHVTRGKPDLRAVQIGEESCSSPPGVRGQEK